MTWRHPASCIYCAGLRIFCGGWLLWWRRFDPGCDGIRHRRYGLGRCPTRPPQAGPPATPNAALSKRLSAQRCLVCRRVDPHRGGQCMGLRAFPLEPLRMSEERRIERGLAGDAHRLGETVVHAVRGHVADARVTVRGVVPREEDLTVRACVLDAAEACRELRPVLHRLELRFREGVVVRDVRPA